MSIWKKEWRLYEQPKGLTFLSLALLARILASSGMTKTMADGKGKCVLVFRPAQTLFWSTLHENKKTDEAHNLKSLQRPCY